MDSNKILQYSTAAVAYISTSADVCAQAVYIDLEPDKSLSPPLEDFRLELNNIIFDDYIFTVGSGFGYSDWCECYVYRSNIRLNGTESKVVYTDYQFTSNQYLVSALEPGIMIDGNLNFKDNDTRMAYRIIPDFSFYYAFEGGDWFPEAIDKYVGIRFTDSLDCIHYGWIRCSVEDNGTKLTIKDYAYETKCDVGIAAGDMIGDTSVAIHESNTLQATVYSFEKTLHIQTGSAETYTVTISNVSGQQLFKNTIAGPYAKIDLQVFAPGIYVVSLISGDLHYVKKVVIG